MDRSDSRTALQVDYVSQDGKRARTDLVMAGSARIFRGRISYCRIPQLESIRTIFFESRYGQGNGSTDVYGTFLRGHCLSLAAMIGSRNQSLQIALQRLRQSEHWQQNAESPALKENAPTQPELPDVPPQDFENQERTGGSLPVNHMSEHA